MVDRERPPIAVLITVFIVELLVLFVGLIVFYGATQSPSFERYRTLDIIRFLGCGGCWGAALAGIGHGGLDATRAFEQQSAWHH